MFQSLNQSKKMGNHMRSTMQNQITLVQSLIVGIQKHLSTVSSLSFGGLTTTPVALIALLTAFVTAANALTAARAQAKNAEVARDLQEQAIDGVVKALKAYVLATYTDIAVLADFGLAPQKARTPLTAAELTMRAAKITATRKARGTLGKAQKSLIHGTVPQATPAVVTTNGAGPVKTQS
jgi:hypothetical protein